MTHYLLRELYLRDAEAILNLLGDRQASFAMNNYGKISANAIRNSITEFKANPGFKAYAWEKESDVQHEPLAFIFFTSSFLQNGSIQVELLLDEVFKEDKLALECLLDALLDEASSISEIKSLVFQIPDSDNLLVELLLEKSFTESIDKINLGNPVIGKNDVWLRSYSVNKIRNWPATWIFIPTELAVFAVYGSDEKISQSRWLYYGEYIEDIAIRSLCINDALADEAGFMIDSLKDFDERQSGYRKIPEILLEAKKQLEEYFSGDREEFNLPLHFSNSTSFQRKVWELSKEIPLGSVSTYEELAYKVMDGDKLAARNFSRATGQALGQNPLCVLIPCHRVIAKDGKLQGYKYGTKIKDWLLAKELFVWKK